MITLGDYSYIGLVHDDYNGDIKIGKFCSIANGVVFLGQCEHPPRDNRLVVSTFNFAERLNLENYPKCSGRSIIIGNDVWIGENVIIIDGSEIGDGCIVGAGAVVSGKWPPYRIIAGNPAEVMGIRFIEVENKEYEWPQVIEMMERIKWWDWPIEKIKEAMPLMSNIDLFIEKYGRIQ